MNQSRYQKPQFKRTQTKQKQTNKRNNKQTHIHWSK